jgi:ADP-ribose diphosphatase
MSEKNLPIILQEEWIASTRLFHVQQLDLQFSNGIPVHNDELILVREYGAGIGDYYLSFPKGTIESNESVTDAANRELQEEAGFAARRLDILRQLALSPSYMGNRMTLVLARDLYPSQLEGDEPEPLEVVRWPLTRIDELLQRDDFIEAYALAALSLLRHRFATESPSR